MADPFSIKFDSSSLDAALDRLGNGVKELARPAAQAGAQVFYDEVQLRVPVSKEARTYKGKRYEPGTLKRSIYQAFSVDNSKDGRATYHISWNAKKAPHGHLIENGHWTKVTGKYGPLQPKWVPAHAFIRPSFDAKQGAALEAARMTFVQGTQGILAGVK